MRVYFVLSEYFEPLSNGYEEPPESGCIAVIVLAETAHRARWQAWKSDSYSRGLTAAEMPNFRCYRLGEAEGRRGVLVGEEASKWWEKVTDAMVQPPPRQWGIKAERGRPGWARDVALAGNDPSL